MADWSSTQVTTPVLDIGYECSGPHTPLEPSTPVILLHGFPYDVRAFDEVAAMLAANGRTVLAPYLRGFGPTRFRSPETMRSGQQGAITQDLINFMNAVGVERAVLAGFDWGGRAACITAALHPERVAGLVSADGYNVQHLASAGEPAPPEWERTYWYQYYFHSERGHRGLERDREALCALLWRTWSPTWAGADNAFPASAPSLHNPDFVDVVVHSYRHRFGLVHGDPRYDAIEAAVAGKPPIEVPTVVLEPGSDGVDGPSAADDREQFTGPYELRALPGIGHNVPQEAPAEFAAAIESLPT